jgi:hypothetical protein
VQTRIIWVPVPEKGKLGEERHIGPRHRSRSPDVERGIGLLIEHRGRVPEGIEMGVSRVLAERLQALVFAGSGVPGGCMPSAHGPPLHGLLTKLRCSG